MLSAQPRRCAPLRCATGDRELKVWPNLHRVIRCFCPTLRQASQCRGPPLLLRLDRCGTGLCAAPITQLSSPPVHQSPPCKARRAPHSYFECQSACAALADLAAACPCDRGCGLAILIAPALPAPLPPPPAAVPAACFSADRPASLVNPCYQHRHCCPSAEFHRSAAAAPCPGRRMWMTTSCASCPGAGTSRSLSVLAGSSRRCRRGLVGGPDL